MTDAHKQNPGRRDRGFATTTKEEARSKTDFTANTSGGGAGCSLQQCPQPGFFPRELFPGRAQAITRAKTVAQLERAIARYAFARLWARRTVRMASDNARAVITHSIIEHAYVRPPAARRPPIIPPKRISEIVMAMDEACREWMEAQG